jgi:hypothetical protein
MIRQIVHALSDQSIETIPANSITANQNFKISAQPKLMGKKQQYVCWFKFPLPCPEVWWPQKTMTLKMFCSNKIWWDESWIYNLIPATSSDPKRT